MKQTQQWAFILLMALLVGCSTTPEPSDEESSQGDVAEEELYEGEESDIADDDSAFEEVEAEDVAAIEEGDDDAGFEEASDGELTNEEDIEGSDAEAEAAFTEEAEDEDINFDEFEEEEQLVDNAEDELDAPEEEILLEEADEVAGEQSPFEEDQIPTEEAATGDDFNELPVGDLPAEETPVAEEPPPVEEPPQELVAPEPTEPEPTYTSDEPDESYEARLYDIYINFHSQQTPYQQWIDLVGTRESEVYGIQSGDTLWDVSLILFGDGNYWPKIWSFNEGITNPHMIRPGMQLRFMLGDSSEPPAFTLTDKVVVKTAQPSESGDVDEVEIPPARRTSVPVIKKLPPSLPEWQSANRGGDYDELGMDFGKRPILDARDRIDLGAYISQESVEESGLVTEMETTGKIAGPLQYVYMQTQKGKYNVGDKVLAVLDRGKIRRANRFVKGHLGYHIEIQGEIEITDKIKGSDEDKDHWRGIVTRSVSPVVERAQLVSGAIETFELDMSGPRSNIVAQIIGGRFENRRDIYGPNSVAFLDRGSKVGLEVGQILQVRSNRQVRMPETEIRENIRPIGYLKVVRTEPEFSTAIVIRSWAPIRTGDITGQGPLMSLEDIAEGVTPVGEMDDEKKDNEADAIGFDENSVEDDLGEDDIAEGEAADEDKSVESDVSEIEALEDEIEAEADEDLDIAQEDDESLLEEITDEESLDEEGDGDVAEADEDEDLEAEVEPEAEEFMEDFDDEEFDE